MSIDRPVTASAVQKHHARMMLTAAIAERCADLHDQWQAVDAIGQDGIDQREALHVKLRATIELEDILYATIDRTATE